MNLKDKNKKDFLDDLIALGKQYGYTPENILDIMCAKPKTELELLLDVAAEKYKHGVMFVDLHDKQTKVSGGNVELLYDRIWCWCDVEGTPEMCLLYRPTTKEWASVVNDVN